MLSFFFLSFHFFFLSFFLSPVPCSNASFDFGYDVCGHALSALSTRGGPDGCLRACQRESRCQFWTFSPEERTGATVGGREERNSWDKLGTFFFQIFAQQSEY